MAQIDQADMPGKCKLIPSFLLKDIIILMDMFLCLEQLITILWVYLFEIYFKEFQDATDRLVHFSSTCGSIPVCQKS